MLVAVLALPGVVVGDLAAPCEVFGRARQPDGRPAYEIRVCAPAPRLATALFEVRPRWRLQSLRRAHTVVVAGVEDVERPVAPAVLRALRAAAARGARVASICTGAFVLAATGLLDGRCATTHWAAASELSRRHPRIRVDPNVLYTEDGNLLTSAGAAAGLDLCLHLVRRDLGSRVAAETARMCVMPLERAGGQAQFIAHEPPSPDGASLEPLQRWLERNLHRPLTLPDIARRAATSTRTLNRRFREQTGTTPLQWLVRARTRRAQHLLETTDHAIEHVAFLVGFGSAATFRDRFRRVVGTSPQAYRRSFRSRAAPDRRHRTNSLVTSPRT